MKKLLLGLLVTAVALIALLPLFACKDGKEYIFELNEDNFYANWMQGLNEDTLLKNVVMPGAHDAATANTDIYEEQLTPPNSNKMLEFFIEKTKCQSASILDLMMRGARYFDLRVTKDSNGVLFTYHSSVNFQPWEDVVAEIAEYLKRGKDFLVLDFQHFENGAQAEALQVFMQAIDFEKYALTVDNDLDTLTLSDIKTSGKRFAVIWSRSTSLAPQYLFARSQWLYSPYAQEKHYSPQTLIDHLDNYYNSFDGHGLFVLQSQCSSNTNTNPRELENGMEPLANNYLLNISEEQLNKTNIVMRDFVDEGDKIAIILSVNLRKNQVKQEYLHLFEYNEGN
ncbi:MAG: hypothetical protein EOM87_01180 [Clostridia bacterium]|nr:hypothetical protein [Clostridia bacterium]